MYQVRYRMTKYGQKHCKKNNNTLYVFFLNMFTQVTSAAVSFLTHLNLSSKHDVASSVGSKFGPCVASKFCTRITTNLSIDNRSFSQRLSCHLSQKVQALVNLKLLSSCFLTILLGPIHKISIKYIKLPDWSTL